MQVLIVDDDELCCTLLREVLRSYGHECTSLHDGEAAWRHLVAQGADVVVSDWKMPGCTGVELCERIRAHPEIVQPHFILLTALGGSADVGIAVRAGVDDHLAKPVDFGQLRERLIAAERARARKGAAGP
ncbi:MAG: cyclic di-GMP phosphodiesterase [Actinomycetota bacterium]|jgi:sigma-B regulation protein RsbU (phosphoserine phosphatase)|nr:cyclic di-GMP phosphodiesterase [Actinomycetota bacterium]MEA2972295.1 cyclic di-GMP phosphodiesterase [Actinomycetota bacterium]